MLLAAKKPPALARREMVQAVTETLEAPLMNGVLVLDKPEGFTSFDAVALMRRLCGERKAGHTGTLDPMATGVLPILLGSGTKAIPFLADNEKEYEASFSLGVAHGYRRPDRHSGGAFGKKSNQRRTRKKHCRRSGGIFCKFRPCIRRFRSTASGCTSWPAKGWKWSVLPVPCGWTNWIFWPFRKKSKREALRMRCSKGTYVRVLIEDPGGGLRQ